MLHYFYIKCHSKKCDLPNIDIETALFLKVMQLILIKHYHKIWAIRKFFSSVLNLMIAELI